MESPAVDAYRENFCLAQVVSSIQRQDSLARSYNHVTNTDISIHFEGSEGLGLIQF